jgi:hypothetical protein
MASMDAPSLSMSRDLGIMFKELSRDKLPSVPEIGTQLQFRGITLHDHKKERFR